MEESDSTIAEMPPKQKVPSKRTWKGRVARRMKLMRKVFHEDVKSARAALKRAGYPVTLQTIYRWESGVLRPPIEDLERIAKAYKCHPGELLPLK